MIYIAVLAAIFIACGLVGAWIVYQLTDVQGDICDMCGAESSRRDRHTWIQYNDRVWCSPSCYRAAVRDGVA